MVNLSAEFVHGGLSRVHGTRPVQRLRPFFVRSRAVERLVMAVAAGGLLPAIC
jgi:hypothetical protein